MVLDRRGIGYQGGLAQDHVLQALHQADDRLGIDAHGHHHDGGEQYHQPARGEGPVAPGVTHLHAGFAHIERHHDPQVVVEPQGAAEHYGAREPPQPGFDRHANKTKLADKAQCHGNT